MLRTTLIVSLFIWTAGCAVNPATGRRQFTLISEGQEIGMGREYDPQIVQSMGLYGGEEWQNYMQRLGMAIVDTARSNLPWTFRVLDDPLVNAFAVPGGYIYITRGILAHFDSEAQLAAVLGHEVAHITARHSVSQMSTQTLLQGAVGIGAVLAPNLQPVFGAASAGVQVLSLKFSRDDESQSDELGLEYMVNAGYDPREMPGVYAMLGRVGGAREGGPPEWLSSHPNPANREQRINELIAQLPNQDFSNRTVNRDAFLRRLDGMVFGENPREGFFDGNVFKHPDMEFEITFPGDWRFANQRSAVVGASSDQNAVMQLTIAEGMSSQAAAEQFFSNEAITGTPEPFRSNNLSGWRGPFVATSDNQILSGYATFVVHRGTIFQIIGYGSDAGWQTHGANVRTSQASFRVLTDPAALRIQPARIEIVRTDRNMALTVFNARYPSEVDIATVALINQMDATETIPAGTLMKRVVR